MNHISEAAMEIRTHNGRPVVRDWRQAAQLISGRYPEQYAKDSPEYDRAWNTYSGGASGGYLLDAELANSVWDKARATDGPLARCRFHYTTSHDFWLPAFNESSRVAGSRWGGVRAYWKGQKDNATMTATKPAIGRVDFSIQDLYVLSDTISNDLLADAPLIEGLLNYASSQEIIYNVVDAMFNGKGMGSPLGILNAPCTVSTTRNTGNSIKYQDIDDMWSKLWGFCKSNATWHATDSVIDAIDQVATAFNWPESFYIPAGKYGNPYPTIKGRPLLVVEQTSALGTAGDLVLADWSQYCLCVRVPADSKEAPSMEMAYGPASSMIEFTSSDHKYFDTDQSIFRWKARMDGKPMWITSVTLADGSGQANSAFVKLV
jgi:HK97 family phage major capsid protein